jgi:hypothetical protein
MGAAAAGIINAFTFGLLPDSIQEIVAEQFASMSEMIFGAIQDVFGASFTGRLKAYIGSALDVFGSFGNLISEIFKGKEGDISGALQDLGGKLLSFVGNWFLWMVEQIPTLYVMAFQFGTKLLSMFWGVLADLFKKGEDIPIVGPVFWLISEYFTLLSNVMGKISDLFGDISAYFKESGVVASIQAALEALAPLGSILMSVGEAWLYWVGFLTAPLWLPIVAVLKTLQYLFRSHRDTMMSIMNVVLHTIPVFLLLKGAVYLVKLAFKNIGKIVTFVVGAIMGQIEETKNLIVGAFEFILEVWDALPDWMMNEVIIPLGNLFSEIANSITTEFANTWELVKMVWNTVSNWFSSNVIDPVESAFGTVKDVIGSAFQKAWDIIVDIFSMSKIGELFGAVVEGISNALNKLLDIGVFKDLIAVAKKAFKISSPSKVFEDIGDDIVAGFNNGIDDLPKSMEKKMGDAAKIAKSKSESISAQATSSKQAAATSAKLPDVSAASTSVDQLRSTVSKIEKLTSAINSAIQSMSAAQAKFVESSAAQLSSLATVSNEAGTTMTSSAEMIMNGGIKQALLAISNLVEKANSLNDAMGSLPDLKLNAKLKTLASGLGIGGKFNYQVKSKDVIINVNLQVEMNAADLEKSLVLREKSVIRNRLNFATGPGTAGKESTDVLPNSPSGVYAFPATAKLVKPRWHENIL